MSLVAQLPELRYQFRSGVVSIQAAGVGQDPDNGGAHLFRLPTQNSQRLLERQSIGADSKHCQVPRRVTLHLVC